VHKVRVKMMQNVYNVEPGGGGGKGGGGDCTSTYTYPIPYDRRSQHIAPQSYHPIASNGVDERKEVFWSRVSLFEIRMMEEGLDGFERFGRCERGVNGRHEGLEVIF